MGLKRTRRANRCARATSNTIFGLNANFFAIKTYAIRGAHFGTFKALRIHITHHTAPFLMNRNKLTIKLTNQINHGYQAWHNAPPSPLFTSSALLGVSPFFTRLTAYSYSKS
jgi:hypothetical protein